MKEHGILFQADMVRAILAGRKTQTRRLVKPQPGLMTSQVSTWHHPDEDDGRGPRFWSWVKLMNGEMEIDAGWCQPARYKVGDRLWVRETWMADPPRDGTWPHAAFDGCKPRDHSLIPEYFRESAHCIYRADGWPDVHGWTPAIHMYRWASRITLEVTAVRCERLHDIDEADAIAEGAPDYEEGVDAPPPDDNPEWCWSYRSAYARLWDRINGPGASDANPWVWVYEFKRLANG